MMDLNFATIVLNEREFLDRDGEIWILCLQQMY
jgi:hypothetical protein